MVEIKRSLYGLEDASPVSVLKQVLLEHPGTKQVVNASELKRKGSLEDVFAYLSNLDDNCVRTVSVTIAQSAPIARGGMRVVSLVSRQTGEAFLESNLPIPDWYNRQGA